jgi:hypothetical protein
MRLPIIALALMVSAAPAARAEFYMACGAGADQGVAQAELSIRDNPETFETLLYLNGKQQPNGHYVVKGGPNGMYYVNFLGEDGNTARHFELSEAKASAQEFSVKNPAEKIGPKMKCIVHEDDAEAGE